LMSSWGKIETAIDKSMVHLLECTDQ